MFLSAMVVLENLFWSSRAGVSASVAALAIPGPAPGSARGPRDRICWMVQRGLRCPNLQVQLTKWLYGRLSGEGESEGEEEEEEREI